HQSQSLHSSYHLYTCPLLLLCTFYLLTFSNTSHINSLGALSYAFSRSTNTMCIFFLLLLYFSIICLNTKIGSIDNLPGIKRNCPVLSFVCFLSLSSVTCSHNFIVWLSSFMPV